MEHVDFDGTKFYKVDDDVWSNAPYAVRVQVGRNLTADEAEQLAGLVGYAYAKTGGERGNGFTQDSPNSIIYYCDTTKGRAYKRLEEFFEDVKVMAVEGSPQRKTKNNTRLVEGLGSQVLPIIFWADSVVTECEHPRCDRATPPCDTCARPHCRTHPCPPDKPLRGTSTDSGKDVAPGIYTTGQSLYRVGKTGRVTQFRARKWRPLTSADNTDATYRIKTSGKPAPAETLMAMGVASGVCLVCGKPLTDSASLSRGMGAKCAASYR